MSSYRAATRSQNAELTNNWLKRLSATANTPGAREAHSQLSSMLDYYTNKPQSKKTEEIDWDGFRSAVHTPDVVDKVRAKYDKFMATEYTVDSAVGRCGTQTEKMQALDITMQYNFMLYFVHYSIHLDQMESVRNIGDVAEMSMLEMIKNAPEVTTAAAMEQEIGNFAPESYTEDGVFTRLCTQFAWGSRYSSPFVHSAESQSCVATTLGKFGN